MINIIYYIDLVKINFVIINIWHVFIDLLIFSTVVVINFAALVEVMVVVVVVVVVVKAVVVVVDVGIVTEIRM